MGARHHVQPGRRRHRIVFRYHRAGLVCGLDQCRAGQLRPDHPAGAGLAGAALPGDSTRGRPYTRWARARRPAKAHPGPGAAGLGPISATPCDWTSRLDGAKTHAGRVSAHHGDRLAARYCFGASQLGKHSSSSSYHCFKQREYTRLARRPSRSQRLECQQMSQSHSRVPTPCVLALLRGPTPSATLLAFLPNISDHL